MGKKNTATFNDFGSAFSKLGFGDVVKNVEETKKKQEEQSKIEKRRAHNREIYATELERINDTIEALFYLNEHVGEEVRDVYASNEYALNDYRSVGSVWMYRLRLKVLGQLKLHIITEEEVNNLVKEYNDKYSEIINR